MTNFGITPTAFVLRRFFLLALLLGLSACRKSSAPAPSGSAAATPAAAKAAETVSLLNVSYDPTREFYAEYNALFARFWQKKASQTVTVKTSHGGSGKQARAVLDGLEADVVTLALGYDVDQLHKRGHLIPENWQSRLEQKSAPYTSTIVFLVRKGNPKSIKDFGDLVRDGIQVITPNPKTSGGARYNYLAAWGFARKKLGKDEAGAKDFVRKLYKNVPVLDSGARGATTTFVERGIGDVLITWENEALLAVKQLGPDKVDLVLPSMSILAEPPVTVVDKYVDKHKTRAVSEAYLAQLYSPEAQALAAKHFYRPRDPKVLEQFASQFPSLELFTVDGEFEGWTKAQKTHFDDGGTFDGIYGKGAGTK